MKITGITHAVGFMTEWDPWLAVNLCVNLIGGGVVNLGFPDEDDTQERVRKWLRKNLEGDVSLEMKAEKIQAPRKMLKQEPTFRITGVRSAVVYHDVVQSTISVELLTRKTPPKEYARYKPGIFFLLPYPRKAMEEAVREWLKKLGIGNIPISMISTFQVD